MINDFAEIGSSRFYYEMAGEGHPLVLVHAGITDRRMWDDQFRVFAQHYKVVRYDRRGFGDTTSGSEAFSHHQDLCDLLKFLGIEQAFLAGCSQGGKTIIDFALEYPEKTNALVLVASALSGFAFPEPVSEQWRQLEQADQAGDVERVNDLEVQIWVDGPRRTPDQVDQDLRERVRAMNSIALTKSADIGDERPLTPPAVDRLDEIHVPALVIIGDLDTPKTIAAADFLAEHIDGVRKIVMAGTAHLPNMERPEEFNRHVLEFLESLMSDEL
jgi:pimeloyl-ACP methyl ester carboxylesterase